MNLINGLLEALKSLKTLLVALESMFNGYELSCLSDLIKASIEIVGSNVKIIFRGFVFVSEHASGSEMSLFSIAYELSEKSEKLYFDNPLGDPCKTSEDEAINAFLDTLAKIFKLCEERSL